MRYYFLFILITLSTFSFSQNSVIIIKTVQSNTVVTINNEILDSNKRELRDIIPEGNSHFKFALEGFEKSLDLWINLDKNDSVVIRVDLPQNIAQPTYYKRAKHSKTEKKRKVFYIVEEMPRFLGKDCTLENYILRSVEERKSYLNKDLKGKIFVQFTVNKKGEINTITIIKGLGNELDAIAVEIIKEMPKWTPGKQRDKPVNVSFTTSIKF